MAELNDKYPGIGGRRRFVKGMVGSAALASIGTGAAAAIGTATSASGTGGGVTQYIGIENTRGPAPRSMPLLPIEIDTKGYLEGVWPEPETKTVEGREVTVAEMEIGDITYSSTWLQYCGVQTYPGTAPDADQDTFFRSAKNPPYTWQSESKEEGEKLHVDDFDDYEEWGNNIGKSGIGKPAMASWRSKGIEAQETIPVQVIRSEKVQTLREDPPTGIAGETIRGFTTESEFVAWLDKCTHFCCVPRFKSYEDSRGFDAEDKVFRNCHQSAYDPFSPTKEAFVALTRPRN